MLCIPVRPRHEMMTHYFSCTGGNGTDSTKQRWDTLRQICVFASGGICGSRNALPCVRGMKPLQTNFHAQVGLLWFP
jgi:hypothetical protein